MASRDTEAALAALAATAATLLIEGETGTGKGRLARRLHALSPRARRPFVHVDCAALPAALIESELFGHERGAFTGAVARRAGRFEAAGDGTVFLDEVGELPLDLQPRLLRVLQDRVFERVGGAQPHPMRARVIAATNRDLLGAVRSGRFRADLYYRLCVVRHRIPPLRCRPGEASRIARAELPALAARLGVRAPVLDEKALSRLDRDPWPGNVRELLNRLEELAVRHPGRRIDEVTVEALLARDRAGVLEEDAVDERARAEGALRQARGNVSEAARRLGWPRSTLRHRLRKWGVG